MSEVTLTVRDEQRSIHSRVHGSVAQRIIGALSADPETIDELQQALLRFQADEAGEEYFFGDWPTGVGDQAWDAGVYIIDLAARMVVGNSSYFSPQHTGSVSYHNGQSVTTLNVRYHIADRWIITGSLSGWESQAAARRQQLAEQRRIDARTVLYDQFYDYAVDECLSHATRPSEDPSVQLHRQWLVTPRHDLGDRSPRDVLLGDQQHLEMDLQYREHQWSRSGRCPPGILRSAAAYRYGGIGKHEWVLHYEFVRFVLQECWSAVQQRPHLSPAEERNRLKREARTWHCTPWPDLQGCSPIQVIDKERRRIPLAVSAKEAILDDDCPLCQMVLESSSPFFWHLDGCQMEDEFAFSFYRTREDWEQDHQRSDELTRLYNTTSPPPERPWQQSAGFDAANGPIDPALALFRIGTYLAELDSDLKRNEESVSLVKMLNRDFGNLRETASHKIALVEPVVTRFCEDLESVGAQRPELADKCADLQDTLQLFSERITNGAP